jgi:hypothetical protein
MESTAPLRTSARPLSLLRRTAGDLHAVRPKLERLRFALRNLRMTDERKRRLARLHALGMTDALPTRLQMIVGAIDMFRFFIVPAADDYYRSKGLRFGFHALLRLLDDPASMVDPTGLASHPDAVIGHLMQVVHANPIYDLQLLQAIGDDDDGLAELERQLEAMLAGVHPRRASIEAIVEDPSYHARLLEYVRAFRCGAPTAALRNAMIRDNVADHPEFLALERTFGTLPGTLAYMRSLPTDPYHAARHLLRRHPPSPPSPETSPPTLSGEERRPSRATPSAADEAGG